MTDIAAIIEHQKLGRFQVQLILLAALCVVVDGFDIQALSFAAPAILDEWRLDRAQFGTVVGAALVGMTIGAPFGGALGDRIGRRPAILLSVVVFGVATFAAAAAQNTDQLALIRLLSGVGFGALLPNATALLSEWIPARHRSLAIGLTIIGIPLGGMAGAAAAGWIIPTYGWRASFLFGGAIALALTFALLATLPESPRFLALRGDRQNKVAKLLKAAFPGAQFGDGPLSVAEPDVRHWTAILTASHQRATLGLALAFFANLLIAYAFFSWAPILLTGLGLPLSDALKGAFYFNVWGLPGAIIGAIVVARLGSRIGLLIAIGATVTALAWLAFVISAGSTITTLLPGLCLAGAGISALQAGLYTLAAHAFPTALRSGGIGFVGGVGRFGAIASAFGGGAVLALQDGTLVFLVGLAVIAIVAALGVLVVDSHTAGRSRKSNSLGQPAA